jgi:hypothetical protein
MHEPGAPAGSRPLELEATRKHSSNPKPSPGRGFLALEFALQFVGFQSALAQLIRAIREAACADLC